MDRVVVAVLVAGCLLLVMAELCRAQLCSNCECLPEPVYRPLCARQEGTGKYRGFRSLCELQCSNRCRKNKYMFVAQQRCGKYLAKLTSTTTSTSPTSEVDSGGGDGRPVGAVEEGSLLGPLVHLLLGAAQG
ncbi:uncharacterized protein LOC126161683 [Schistocerca cancellata]|uniref:uncharacterized protein LOC126161683 n=1 Tax=Schistocerca cancellata TaxID=274614 RepID=UPI0021189E46|nr:uncharacterized protein LOC126161683 [Schistocerca cancellata]